MKQTTIFKLKYNRQMHLAERDCLHLNCSELAFCPVKSFPFLVDFASRRNNDTKLQILLSIATFTHRDGQKVVEFIATTPWTCRKLLEASLSVTGLKTLGIRYLYILKSSNPPPSAVLPLQICGDLQYILVFPLININ
jgi:hypothetical protein